MKSHLTFKRAALAAVTCSVLFGAVWLNQVLLWPITRTRLACNSEYVRLIHWTKGGYDSWGWDYSDGHQMQPDGTWKNLWHWPKWHRQPCNLIPRTIKISYRERERR